VARLLQAALGGARGGWKERHIGGAESARGAIRCGQRREHRHRRREARGLVIAGQGAVLWKFPSEKKARQRPWQAATSSLPAGERQTDRRPPSFMTLGPAASDRNGATYGPPVARPA